MPFTTYHLASGLLIGFLLRKYVYWPSFLIATTIVVDIDFLIYNIIFWRYSPHGYLHTYLASIVIGAFMGYLIYLTRAYTHSFFRELYLAYEEPTALNSILGSIGGWALHVFMDSLVYTDIKPFLPIQYNPLYVEYSRIYVLLDVILFSGLITYFIHLYRVSKSGNSLVSKLRIGFLMVLVGLLAVPMGLCGALYICGDLRSWFYILAGEFLVLLGLGLVTQALVILGHFSRVKSWITLLLVLVAVILFNILEVLHNPSDAIMISWVLSLVISLLLRKPLRVVKLEFSKFSISIANLLVVAVFLSAFVVGIPLLLLSLLLLAAKARNIA